MSKSGVTNDKMKFFGKVMLPYFVSSLHREFFIDYILCNGHHIKYFV